MKLVEPRPDFGTPVNSIKLIFARNLRRLMRDKDVKSKDLAEFCGVSGSIVTQWRNADKFPGSDNLDKLQEYFKVPYSEFVREVDPESVSAPDAEAILYTLAKLLNKKVSDP